MYFNAKISVTIAGQLLSTIVSVKTSNDGQKIGAYCDLVVPLNSYIAYQNPNDLKVYLTAIRVDKYSSGDEVIITASYDGFNTINIFNGFVYDFTLGMPTTIRCMDYIYYFNLGIFGDKRVFTTNKKGTKIKKSGLGVNYKSIQFRDILQQLIDFVNETIDAEAPGSAHVSLILDNFFDMTLSNLTFISMSPAAILEWFKKEVGFNISLYGNRLFVNLASTTTGSVILNTGRNVIESKLQTVLQKSVKTKGITQAKSLASAFEKIRLKCWFIREDGTRDSLEIGDPNGVQEERFFYKVKRDATNYEKLAEAALLKAQQHRYHGELEILLYPECDLFWRVPYTDIRYPEKSAVYVIIGIYFELGEKGFHRRLKVAWLSDFADAVNQADIKIN